MVASNQFRKLMLKPMVNLCSNLKQWLIYQDSRTIIGEKSTVYAIFNKQKLEVATKIYCQHANILEEYKGNIDHFYQQTMN